MPSAMCLECGEWYAISPEDATAIFRYGVRPVCPAHTNGE